MTSPTGSNPTARTAASSATERSLPQVPPVASASAIRFRAVTGSPPPSSASTLARSRASDPPSAPSSGMGSSTTVRSSLPVERDDHLGLGDRVVRPDRPHGRPERQELDHMTAPEVRLLDELNPDDALRVERLGLFLHPRHGELTGLVESLREVGQLLAGSCLGYCGPGAAVRDVVDAGPHHEPERHVPGLDERPEVLTREVARERLAVLGPPRRAVR